MKIIINIENGDYCHNCMFRYISISKMMILIIVFFCAVFMFDPMNNCWQGLNNC